MKNIEQNAVVIIERFLLLTFGSKHGLSLADFVEAFRYDF